MAQTVGLLSFSHSCRKLEVLLSEELNQNSPHLETQGSIDSDGKGRYKKKWRERDKMSIYDTARRLLPSGLEIRIFLCSGPQRRN